MLAAASTVVSVSKEGSTSRVCATPLLAKAGVDGKESEGRALLAGDKNILNIQQREEKGGLLLHSQSGSVGR